MGSFTPPPTRALAPGDRLDRYELLCVLAQGGMGTVWLARITGKHGFERLIALKTILATYENDRSFCDMFLDEARIASQIDHENVARILEIGEDRGVLYHAMELIDGESLRKVYRDIRGVGAPFPLAVALRIAADTCAGLHAVHELKGADGVGLDVVHRDVSPQNLLITIRGTIKLIDFGVAKARQRRTEETTAGTLKGKIEYMAPEQAVGEKLDRRADIYSVGAVLYELLSGSPVRNTDDGRQLLALHELMTGAPYQPLRTSIPLPVRSLVDRALSRNPEDRYRTAEDMRHALEQAMINIGHVANTDDVANVLGHFSRERTTKRKEAIEAAVRAAQTVEKRQSLRTVVAPVSAPQSNRSLSPGHVSGPSGTRVIDVGSFTPPGEGPTTGPSMRTMQGASISGHPPAQPTRMSAGKVAGIVAVLGLVASLGVTIGVVLSRPPRPTAASGGDLPARAATPTSSVTSTPASGVPAVADPSGHGVGASDAGTATATPSASAFAKPATKKGKGKERASGKPDGDEYGF
jgi:eukaryotic-like serine/threonine-protein kinase